MKNKKYKLVVVNLKDSESSHKVATMSRNPLAVAGRAMTPKRGKATFEAMKHARISHLLDCVYSDGTRQTFSINSAEHPAQHKALLYLSSKISILKNLWAMQRTFAKKRDAAKAHEYLVKANNLQVKVYNMLMDSFHDFFVAQFKHLKKKDRPIRIAGALSRKFLNFGYNNTMEIILNYNKR